MRNPIERLKILAVFNLYLYVICSINIYIYFKSISGKSVVCGYCNISHLLKYPTAKWAWLTKVGGHRQTVVASIVRKKKMMHSWMPVCGSLNAAPCPSHSSLSLCCRQSKCTEKLCRIWQYQLWSFKSKDTIFKLAVHLPDERSF